MVGTVNQLDFYIGHREAAENTAFNSFFDAFFNRGNIFARNRAAGDFVFEDNAGTGFARIKLEDNMTVLAMSAPIAWRICRSISEPAG